jgi:NADH-quinone oxidoreductase subunit N
MVSTNPFGRLVTVLPCIVAVLTLLLSVGYTGRRPLGHEEYPSLVLFAAFGMALLGSSISLLGIFLGLESMTLALYVLLASNRADPLSGEAGLKYLILGAVSTAFFAFGLSLIYFATGTLSVSGAIGGIITSGRINPLGLAGWAMLLVGLGFKVSVFPFQLWAPDVYQGGPAPVVGLLSTGSKVAVFAAFLRLALASSTGWGSLVPVLWVIAALTMAYGNIAALTQDNIKRLLAYSSIAQMGYVLVALIAAPSSGGTYAVFYLIAFLFMDIGAFGAVAAFSGKDGELGDIGALKGLGFVHPFRAFTLSICLVSLAGLPPTAGFIGKFGIFFGAMKAGYVGLAAIGIVTAIISVYYYLRVVVYLYMRPAGEPEEPSPHAPIMPTHDWAGRVAMAFIIAAIFYLGVLPGWVLNLIAGITEGASL